MCLKIFKIDQIQSEQYGLERRDKRAWKRSKWRNLRTAHSLPEVGLKAGKSSKLTALLLEYSNQIPSWPLIASTRTFRAFSNFRCSTFNNFLNWPTRIKLTTGPYWAGSTVKQSTAASRNFTVLSVSLWHYTNKLEVAFWFDFERLFWGFLLRVCLFVLHKLNFQIIFNVKYYWFTNLPTL